MGKHGQRKPGLTAENLNKIGTRKVGRGVEQWLRQSQDTHKARDNKKGTSRRERHVRIASASASSSRSTSSRTSRSSDSYYTPFDSYYNPFYSYSNSSFSSRPADYSTSDCSSSFSSETSDRARGNAKGRGRKDKSTRKPELDRQAGAQQAGAQQDAAPTNRPAVIPVPQANPPPPHLQGGQAGAEHIPPSILPANGWTHVARPRVPVRLPPPPPPPLKSRTPFSNDPRHIKVCNVCWNDKYPGQPRPRTGFFLFRIISMFMD